MELFVELLDVEDVIAQLLVTEGYNTIESIINDKFAINFTPGRDELIVPYVVLPASPAPVTFNFVLTIYFY